MNINVVTASIAGEIDIFQQKYKTVLHSSNTLVDKVSRYVLRQQGKQIRPTLVLLSAAMCGGITEATYRAAIMVELLHSATLIHDDVVDGAEMRRGIASINALWKNKISVLIGDFLLSKGLLYSLDHKDYTSLHTVSEAVRRMSEGEILQIQKTRSLDISEEDYLSVISDKTASLIASSCAMGASSVTDDTSMIAGMKHYGEYLGLAFQIRDDLLDYTGDSKKTGKQMGIDIKDKKITLPLIHALRNSPASEQKHIRSILKSSKKRAVRSDEVIAFVKSKGGLEYAAEVAEGFAAKAVESLGAFPHSEAKVSLLNLVDFVMKRQH
ncbi:MAG: polyprenyl synthetase family protein [Chlorobium sp.]|uniref:polyprenyl synthetase family protein n=1 Tax=Chlorobium sp. TaxID=1095 RepID=UPI001E13C976|nr:polyprenyl synthetase family protein [Chlorobium sp.]MBN1279549.1 polyprenyl synthetase family protein [Chlorobiaceae bacterium]MCF8215837.1 polyprenyl synthetase family protein [Chlorobium sp.]MCF8270735.1 polyprenyl synthetase family protein [Chlorobium sp.]MCF8287047.1 polyprenyl synthetase family protein [Chlorobium sp.]MCF8290704.1 polyprenyl synthetase family protein [Chlorobium sp.]